MGRRASFSNDRVGLAEINAHHVDLESALENYFAAGTTGNHARFFGYTPGELSLDLQKRVTELNHTSSLSLLAALEAMFRIDYLVRNYKKKKDPLSRALRDVYASKAIKASLEDDILDAWKEHTSGASVIIGDVKGALKYRHWLAHGRYWIPKMGRHQYDYESLYELAELVLNNFPFETADV